MTETKRKPLLIWILIILVLIAVGYFTYPSWKPWFKKNITETTNEGLPGMKEDSISIYNTWISEIDGAMLSIKPNGNYSLDVPSVDNGKTVYGHYKIQGKRIIFMNHASSNVCVGIEGGYRFTASKESITFKVLSDPCKSRKHYLTGGWFIL